MDLYVDNPMELEKWISALARTAIMRDIDDDFTLLEEVGEGRYSVVYRAISQHSPAKAVAVKRLWKASSRNALHRVISEVTALRHLRHSGINPLHHVYEGEDHVDLVLDYAPDGSLGDRIERDGALGSEVAAELLGVLLQVLAYLHECGITHRDIKPENVLCFGDTFKLSDFGLAAFATSDMKDHCGTHGFAAPEVFTTPRYDSKSDVYSAGMTVLAAILGVQVPPPHSEQPHWLHHGLIEKMLSEDPVVRPTAAEALQCFHTHSQSTPKGPLPAFRFPFQHLLKRRLTHETSFHSSTSTVQSCS